MNFLLELNPIIQAAIATIFTWLVTLSGSALVFCFKNLKREILDSMLGFGAGVMIAASFWSLITPSIELCATLGYNKWMMPAFGFLCGGLFIVGASKLMDRYSFESFIDKSKNKTSSDTIRRSILLVLAVTLHNIPEGFAIGVSFGGAALNIPGLELVGAISLAIGIGLQNFPEGAAVSLPLYREGFSKKRSFMYGQLSAIVEPIAGVIGAYSVVTVRFLLPFLCTFAAGAMIGIVAAELIPESAHKSKNLATFGVILGFILMMILDVALG